MKVKIGSELFDNPNMDVTGSIITSQDDEFMRNINEKYEGAGGQSVSNSIQGFHDGRKLHKPTVFGKFMDRFGSSIKEFFVQ